MQISQSKAVIIMDFEKLMEERLKGHNKRIAHTKGVVKRALELGKIYQADLEVLKVAAYFHDITKYEPLSFHKQMIKNKKVLKKYPEEFFHAYSGAAYAKEKGIQNKKIIEAIKYHNYGKKKMNLETMILCVSDYCEENRVYEDAKIAYQIALDNLTASFVYMLKETLDYLKINNIKPLKQQIKVYNYYNKRRKQKDEFIRKNTESLK